MFRNFSRSPRKFWSASIVALCCCPGWALAQNFSLQLADTNPLGIDSFVPGLEELGLVGTGGLKGELRYGIQADTVYNSNFGLTDTNEESEVSLFLAPWITYDSDPEGGAAVTFTAGYSPVARVYADNDQLNDIDQNGDMTLRFRGSRTEIALFSRYSEVSGTDRLTGSFVSGSLVTSGVRANRQIASRTSLNAGFSYAVSDYDSATLAGAELYSTYFGASWQASPRLSLGPTLRYNFSESDLSGEHDAWALLVNARYQAGNRLWLVASIGPEYSTSSGAGVDDSSLGLTVDLSAAYVIDPRWTWTNSIRTAVVPSPSETNYVVNDYGFQSTIFRSLTRGSAYGGLEVHLSDYQDVGVTTVNRDDDLVFSVMCGYRRPLFSERVEFNGTIRYSVNDGDTDWEQLMVSASLRVVF